MAEKVQPSVSDKARVDAIDAKANLVLRRIRTVGKAIVEHNEASRKPKVEGTPSREVPPPPKVSVAAQRRELLFRGTLLCGHKVERSGNHFRCIKCSTAHASKKLTHFQSPCVPRAFVIPDRVHSSHFRMMFCHNGLWLCRRCGGWSGKESVRCDSLLGRECRPPRAAGRHAIEAVAHARLPHPHVKCWPDGSVQLPTVATLFLKSLLDASRPRMGVPTTSQKQHKVYICVYVYIYYIHILYYITPPAAAGEP